MANPYQISVEQIAPAFLSDSIVVKDWEVVADFLIVTNPSRLAEIREEWRRMKIPCWNSLFKIILSQWVRENWNESTIGKLEDTLRKWRYNFVADELRAKGERGTRITPDRVVFNVNPPVHSFTGRETERESLHEKLHRQSPPGATYKRTVVHGIGGIGKTQLCLSYIKNMGHLYGGVFWLDGKSHDSLEKGFLRIADREDVPVSRLTVSRGDEKDPRTIVEELYNYFSRETCLVVIDNCDDPSVLYPNFMPKRDFQGPLHLVLTSRNKPWDVDVNYVELKDWTEAEAIEFIGKELGGVGQKEEEAKELASCLQYFPLTLQQAVAYILPQRKLRQGAYTVVNYLADYQAKRSELLKSDYFRRDGGRDDYKMTTYTTWEITLEACQKRESIGNAAIEIIEIIAFLLKDGISRKSFFKLRDYDAGTVREAVDLLVSYSMLLSVERGDDIVLNIHKLVQDVIREKLLEKEGGLAQSRLRTALLLVNSPGFEQLDHVTSVWHYASQYFPLIDEFYSASVYKNGETPLHLLAGIGDEIGVKSIVDRRALTEWSWWWWWRGYDRVVNALDRFERTPVWMAASCGAAEAVKFLIARGARLDVKSFIMGFDTKGNNTTTRSFGRTPLHVAAFQGHLDVVKIILKCNPNLANIPDDIGRTPVQLAAVSGQCKVVAYMERESQEYLAHAKFHARFTYGEKAEEFDDYLQEELDEATREKALNLRVGGFNILHVALRQKCPVEFCKRLVRNGARVDEESLSTLLQCAAGSGFLAGAKWLVEAHNANPANPVPSSGGWTPLHAACQGGHTKVVSYFLDLPKVNINLGDENNTTPLHTAAYHGKLEVVQTLMEGGASPNLTNVVGLPPILAAALTGEYQVVTWMLDNHSDILKINASDLDDKGETLLGRLDASLLHFAAAYDQVDLAERLFREGLVEVDVGSLSPLHIAVFCNSIGMVQLLIKKKANISAEIKFEKLVQAISQSLRDGTISINNGLAKFFIRKLSQLSSSRSSSSRIGKLLNSLFGISPLSMSQLEGFCELEVCEALAKAAEDELGFNESSCSSSGWLTDYLATSQGIAKYTKSVRNIVHSRKCSRDGVLWVDKTGLGLRNFFNLW